MTVAEKQAAMMPKDDLAPYAGEWVALRAGHVVAHACDALALRDDPQVARTDVIACVPSHPESVFVR